MKGVILAGGTGSRLRPITHTGPKQLIPVANKPVLQYAIEDLADVGITDIGIVLGRKGRDEIQRFVGDGSDFGVDITYIIQGEPLGLAHAVGCAKSFVGNDDFVVYLGDNILKQGIGDMVTRYRKGNYAAGIALQRVDNPAEFGIVELNESGRVIQLVEKPEKPASDLALIGIYIFSPVVFDVIEDLEPSWRGELEITDAIQLLLESGELIDSHIVEGWWKDTGKPGDILAANQLVLDEMVNNRVGTVEEGADISNRLDLAESATIQAGAVVRGPVTIGSNTVIHSDTYIGPYSAIGDNCDLRQVHLENSVVIGGSTIDTPRRIVDSLLGRGTVIESTEDLLPEGKRIVAGENSKFKL